MDEPIDDIFANVDTSEFVFYRDFLNVEEAQSFCEFLSNHNIRYSLESTDILIDAAIVGNGLIPKAVVKIHPDQFERVNTLIGKEVQKRPIEELEAHYLNEFNARELLELVNDPESWSVEDYNIAQVLLEHRGIPIAPEKLAQDRAEKLERTRAGKSGNRLWMWGYFLGSIAGFWISWALTVAGIGMSYYYAYGKDTDSSGTSYFVYDAPTRVLGRYFLYGGVIICFLFWVAIVVLPNFI